MPLTLPAGATARMLPAVKRSALVWLALGALAASVVVQGCGANGELGDGTGGDGADPLARQRLYELRCTIDTLVLELPIELSYRLDGPYIASRPSDLTFSAAVVFGEQAAAALIDAGVPEIDIISIELASSVQGALPALLQTSFTQAPINDFDLTADPDQNGLPGPHWLELEEIVVASTPAASAEQVELGLASDQISMVLGDFELPADCAGLTLVGLAARFPVAPSR